jgi:rhodanese-related sulfurtransferase
MTMAGPTLPDTSPVDAFERRRSGVLVDVRERDEWDAGHAPDALHIPLSRLTPDAVPPDVPVLCICRSGARSSRATALLAASGIDAVNVAGGMQAWAAAGLPVVRDDGAPGGVA